MNKPIIEIKGVGKKYDITHQRGKYVALRDVLTNILKRPFHFLKKKAKQVVGLETKEEFWALKDVDFEVQKGEVIGIIGRNGAGKSTLLKILTGITPPTEGEIVMRGRVASLLEVGTGFHPELTGRENIFLNGAILGMTKKEIARKFDEIVAFAGIEKFLDTPVKYYSSGMYVRLAFSVAAHMEPDILLVDEVLAVGDAEFQKKCLGKMEEVATAAGRTILFVSHNLAAVQSLCKKTALIERGRLVEYGETHKVIASYVNKASGAEDLSQQHRQGSGEIKLTSIGLIDEHGAPTNTMGYQQPFNMRISYEAKEPVRDIIVSIGIYSSTGHFIGTFSSFDQLKGTLPAGNGTILFRGGPNDLMAGTYSINITVHTNNTFLSMADHLESAYSFSVIPDQKFPRWMDNALYFDSRWEIV